MEGGRVCALFGDRAAVSAGRPPGEVGTGGKEEETRSAR